MDLAASIRSHRVSRRMRQLDLARRIKVTLGSVSRWERGECLPNLEQFRQLCLALKVSADAILKLPKSQPRRVVPLQRPSPAVVADDNVAECAAAAD